MQLCKTISREFAARCTQDIGMGSESSDESYPFYMAAQVGSTDAGDIPTEITAEMIRAKFEGTIFPFASVTVEPLQPEGS